MSHQVLLMKGRPDHDFKLLKEWYDIVLEGRITTHKTYTHDHSPPVLKQVELLFIEKQIKDVSDKLQQEDKNHVLKSYLKWLEKRKKQI